MGGAAAGPYTVERAACCTHHWRWSRAHTMVCRMTAARQQRVCTVACWRFRNSSNGHGTPPLYNTVRCVHIPCLYHILKCIFKKRGINHAYITPYLKVYTALNMNDARRPDLRLTICPQVDSKHDGEQRERELDGDSISPVPSTGTSRQSAPSSKSRPSR